MKYLYFLILPFIVSGLFPMDWPTASPAMQKNFGWNDDGIPHLGITFNTDGAIEAAEAGELLFYRGEKDRASRLPSPLGSWTALDHGDGIISIYSRFDDKSRRQVPDKAEKSVVLAEAGTSGWSSMRGFYFQLYDRKERRWINPSLIVTALEDTRQPVVLSVRLKDDQGTLYNPYQLRTLNQGRYTVIVETIDNMRTLNENPLAPYRIVCLLNGSEAGALNFENFSVRDGSLMVYRNGLLPAKQVYASFPAYAISDLWLTRGQTSLEIISQDIAGNVRNVLYRFMVE